MIQGTITRKLDSTLCDLFDEFKCLCTVGSMRHRVDMIIKLGDASNKGEELQKLYDMFDACGIKYKRNQSDAYYAELVECLAGPTDTEVLDNMLLDLFQQYMNYPDPNTYMERIVDRLSFEEDQWDRDSLRLRILKQFIKYGDYLRSAGYGGQAQIKKYVKNKIKKDPNPEEILSNLDDEIFEGLESANKDQKSPEGKYGLIKLADDLGTGKFRAGGATKKALYLFAMVYNMTYLAGGQSEDVLYYTDIEKNLFQDYYTNNMMRFLSSEYSDGKEKGGYESEPSGQGINYKNFAEMIYLYFISQNDLSPVEKIERSSRMIRDVLKEARRVPQNLNETEKLQGTRNYMAAFKNIGEDIFSESVLSMSEPDFQRFICENYDCNTGSLGPLQVESEQNSAYHQYCDIVGLTSELAADQINEYGIRMGYSKYEEPERVPLSECNYGLWFTDIKNMEQICSRHGEIDKKEFRKFIKMLDHMDRFMTEKTARWNSEAEKTTPKALTINNPASMTRSSLVIAFYYYFNLFHFHEDDDERWVSFQDLFNAFKNEVDQYLIASYYQPFSGKDIFDVLIAFSAYAYLNI